VVGQTAVFSVSAMGTPPLSYQWMFNTTNIAGATNTSLVLGDVQLTDAGTYRVVVSNLVSSVLSSNAMLTVNPAPTNCDPVSSGLVSWWPGEGNANDVIGGNNGMVIGGLSYTNGEVGQAFQLDGTSGYVDVPASGSLNVGTNNGFTVEGWINPSDISAQRPVVEWKVDGSVGAEVHLWISVGGTGCLYANLVDVNNVGHSLATVAGVIQAGVFQHVAVTYDKVSGVADLYWNGSVVATANVGSFTPKTGNDLLLGCRLNNGGGGVYFAGALDEISLYNRALTSDEVAAIYGAGSAGKCFAPTGPAIFAQPTNQTVVVGQTAVFSVSAMGTPPLSYQWMFNTTNIAGATNASLVLNNVQLTNAGSYSVMVSNLVDSVPSSNAMLTVLAPANIVSQPTNEAVYVGGTASFTVTASGTSPLSYHWNFNQTNIANATNAILVLTNVQPSQAGNYAVLVTNLVNSAVSSNALLTVNLLPTLGVMPSGNYLYIFWPISASGFTLETTPSLSPANWVVVSNPPIQIGGEYLQSIQITATNQFYRLQLNHQ
jgi:Concanavalin A-like lectin/glucanases superfamily/Immunoglobulin domain/Immunoglobulin I-set domain